MHATSANPVIVEPGGEGVVAHVGLHALGAFADRLGLTAALSGAVPAPVGGHDRGKVLVQAMLMLAGGGVCCADIEHLRTQPALFGSVASDSTLYRTIRSLDGASRDAIGEAMAAVRAKVWEATGLSGGDDPVVLDLDASLIQIHSEHKQGAAPTYKRGFGFAPMFCFADATGEALGVYLRPGNAVDHAVDDQMVVIDMAIAQLPEAIAAGHRPGDVSDLPARSVIVRADSAAGYPGTAAALRARNIGFSVVARKNPRVHAAIMAAIAEPWRWRPALTQTGEVRDRAEVAELTDLIDLSGWPPGTRFILRREPLHPGAQTSLFPDLEFRYWGHYTDGDLSPVDADVFIRAHAHVEDNIRRLKDSGLERFPFADLGANRAWLDVVCAAADLVRWFQLRCLTGHLAVAEPKTLRFTLWATPARTVRRARRQIVRILGRWPTADALLGAYARIAALA